MDLKKPAEIFIEDDFIASTLIGDYQITEHVILDKDDEPEMHEILTTPGSTASTFATPSTSATPFTSGSLYLTKCVSFAL